ncbi:MAG: FtsX-like permease family protein [Lachnospiraceae bacterium]
MFYLILDNISRRRGVFWGMVFLNTIALLAIGTSCYITGLNNRNTKSTDGVLAQGIYQSGMVWWDNGEAWSEDDITAFFNELEESDEIAAVGAYWYPVGDRPYWTPLIEAQDKTQKSDIDLNNSIRFLSMNYSMVNFCNLEIAEGIDFGDAIQYDDDLTAVIYLGADFSDIPVGSVHEVRNKDERIMFRYYVAGRLKEDCYWAKEGLASDTGDFLPSFDKVCLDHMFITLDNRGISLGGYYSPESGYTLEEATQRLSEISDNYGLNAHTEVLADLIYNRDAFNREMIRYSSGIAILVIGTTITIMICMQLSALVLRSREYGVLYANGYRRKDLILISVGENLVRGFVSVIFAATPLYLLVCQLSLYDWNNAKKSIFFCQALPAMIIVMLLVVVIGSVVPVVTFLRKQPVELLENRF